MNHCLYYGVQWHPERMRDDRILPCFVSLLSAAS